MDTERVDRLRWLFNAALLHPPAERADFLMAACPDAPELRQEIEELLAAENGFFLDEPPPDWEAAWNETEEPEDDLVGASIGAYNVLRQIGRGGMGDVYLGLRSKPFRQYVALKVMRRGMDSRDMLRRFEMERQILASLNHPHIARLFDGGMTDKGRSYFVMEYVEGEPLTRYCDELKLPIEERLRLFQRVCDAVQYAHQNLILHRDLKPSNILITQEGAPKLLDFGVAKLLNPVLTAVDVPITRTNVRVMTPAYASPEQVRGDLLTTTSDVYSLGVILYELLTGHRPYHFDNGTAEDILKVVCEQNPERPSTKVGQTDDSPQPDGTTSSVTPSDISSARGASVDQLQRHLQGDLDNIVMMALRKEPRRRYASAEQFAEDIERFLDGRPVMAHRDSRRYRLEKFVARHRAGVFSAAAFTLLLLAFSIVTVIQSSEIKAYAATVEQERDRTEVALAESEEVSEFLSGLFRANSPTEARGDTLTARQLLERGVDRIETLADQPVVQARMMDVLGHVYYQMGQYDRARPLLEQALTLRKTHLGETAPETARSMHHLGQVLAKHDDSVKEAERLHRASLAIFRQHHSRDHVDVAIVLNSVGYVLDIQKKNQEEAEHHYLESLAMRRRLFGDNHPDVALALHNLGFFNHRRGRRAEAEAYYREAFALRQQLLGEDHPDISYTANNLGVILRQQEKYEDARRFLREAVRIRKKTMGEHPAVIQAMINLSTTEYSSGNYAASEEVCREALNLSRAWLGNGHYFVPSTLTCIGNARLKLGNLDAADAAFREALRLRRQYRGFRHGTVGHSLRNVGNVYKARGQYPEAEASYLEALSILREHYDDQNRRIVAVFQSLADLYETWDRPDDAARYTAFLASDD